MPPSRVVAGLLAPMLALGCSQDSASGTPSSGSGDPLATTFDPGMTTVADASAGVDGGVAADTGRGTSATTDGAAVDETAGPVVFDLGAVPDAPKSTGFVGIPSTCAEAQNVQSTVGCSFRGNRMQNFQSYDASVVVGNVSESQATSVQLYYADAGGEAPQGAAVMVPPLSSYEFILSQPGPPGNVSVHRQAGTYRVQSDFPIVAYQHSPIGAVASNDSSMLIPDHALGQFYIIASWPTTIPGNSSAFNVIGVQDATTVQWQPRMATQSGTGVQAVGAFGLGSAVIDNNDLLQVVAAVDTSGTIIETDKPAWVMGTNPCANVPAGVTFCDHLEELLIPVEYWGTEYVGAHAPTRGTEQYWWRVYSGADGVTITTTPAEPGTPVMLDRGEFFEFSTSQSVIFEGTGGFMPVQYLEGQDAGAGTGDPAVYQMVPTEQFLPRYVFVTGVGYVENYVQVTRPLGAADVFVDGVLVGGYTPIGAFEVSDWPIAEGAHVADSTGAFGIVQVGYTGVTSYAYPGGLALGFINPTPQG